jgi:NifU-like protein involved in Fe-S cluster formation
MTMTLSSEMLTEYAKNPSNKGLLANPTITRRETNRLCDDAITVHLRIEDGRLAEFGFE